ncbi:MAG TPA: hypothetical protein VN048_04800 [Verrucomicrobiae bacterium]|jgi:hypothetical protein|nr:hypothetical protein [Verrucomicrobiae bacterium]
MKLNKLALTVAAGCAIVSTVQADTTFYISGSTAYRKSTYAALSAMYGAGIDVNYPIGDTSSTATGSGAANVVNTVGNGSANLVWSGTPPTLGLGHVVVVCNWSGSISGQKADAESALWPTFLAPGTTAGTENFVPAVPDMNVSDNFQKTTTYFPPGDPAAVNLTRSAVAIIEFIVAKDPSAPADLTDVSSLSLRQAYKLGYLNTAQLTGNAAENNTFLLPVGRDDDSGTRTIFEADNGIAFTATLLQWGLHSTVVDGTPGYTPYQFPLASINANDGSGYASGGTLAKVFNDATGPGTIVNPVTGAGNVTSYFIGYCSVTDATGVIAPANFLNYNGVAWSTAVVEEGQYTYWGYENVDVRPAHNNGATHTFYSALVTGEQGQAGVLAGTIAIGNMNCSRSADGGLISHN